MTEFQCSCREIAERVVCSLVVDAGMEAVPRDFVRRIAEALGVFENEDVLDEIIYGAKLKVERELWKRRNPPESADVVREQMARMKQHYEVVIFWMLIAGIVAFIVGAVFFSP